jgi:hypothetical protein
LSASFGGAVSTTAFGAIRKAFWLMLAAAASIGAAWALYRRAGW